MEVISVNYGVFKLAMVLRHPNAAEFRTKTTDILCRAFAGDERLVQSIRANARGESDLSHLFQNAHTAATGQIVLPPPAREMCTAEDMERLRDISKSFKEILDAQKEMLGGQKQILDEKKEFEAQLVQSKENLLVREERLLEKKHTLEMEKLKYIRETRLQFSQSKRARTDAGDGAGAAAADAPPKAAPVLSIQARFASALAKSEGIKEIRALDLWSVFGEWNTEGERMTMNRLFTFLKTLDGVECERDAGGICYFFRHDRIKQSLKWRKMWDEEAESLDVDGE
jgi:hypothetical protein